MGWESPLTQKFWPAPLGGEPGSPGGAGAEPVRSRAFWGGAGLRCGARLHPKTPGSTPKFGSAPRLLRGGAGLLFGVEPGATPEEPGSSHEESGSSLLFCFLFF